MERLLVILTLLMGFGLLVELIVGLLFHRITHKVVCVITIMGHFIGLEDFLAIIHEAHEEMVFLLCILFMGNDVVARADSRVNVQTDGRLAFMLGKNRPNVRCSHVWLQSNTVA